MQRDPRWRPLDNGRIGVEAGAKGNPDVTLTATAEAWASYAGAVSPVGFQSLNGMMRAGFLTARGNMLEFCANLAMFRRVEGARGLSPETCCLQGLPGGNYRTRRSGDARRLRAMANDCEPR